MEITLYFFYATPMQKNAKINHYRWLIGLQFRLHLLQFVVILRMASWIMKTRIYFILLQL